MEVVVREEVIVEKSFIVTGVVSLYIISHHVNVCELEITVVGSGIQLGIGPTPFVCLFRLIMLTRSL